VAGPVILEPDTGWFMAMQSLEFFGLTGVSAGSAGLNGPIMCNAANMAYLKEDFRRFLESGQRPSESGDDIFLLLWLKKVHPGTIRYMTNPRAAILTTPAKSPVTFLMQRFRWASKGRLYRDFHMITTALLVYLTSACLLLAGILSFVAAGWIKLFGAGLLVKGLTDLIFADRVLKHYSKRKLLFVFLPLELVYFVYVSIVGLASQLIPYTWKERNIHP